MLHQNKQDLNLWLSEAEKIQGPAIKEKSCLETFLNLK